MYNILLACDTSYYNQWTKNCIKSIKHFVPWIDITVIIVNPYEIEKLPDIQYAFDYVDFKNNSSKVPYYQAVRFLKCAEIFPDNSFVMSIDCDTVLTRKFSKDEFVSICESIHVQRHQKDKRWMAGLVTFGKDTKFRKQFRERLLSFPLENWSYGRDQDVLEEMSFDFAYKKLYVGDWMSFGRGGGRFLTLKGDQKTSPGYLENYNGIIGGIK